MATQLTFEELYVVSDLHIGDTKGTPIFAQTKELAALIRWLGQRQTPHGGSIGLVLNGDILDTLPEAMRGYVCSPEEAEGVVDAIVTHAAFADIFDALAYFCGQAKKKLVMVLGNHDLELVYPNVQELLLQRLGADGNELVRARVIFATAGTGFRCCVGSTAASGVSVACVHGNEFDGWNAFDPENVAQLIRASTLGYDSPRTLSAPNPGTRLVRDVMNGIKAQFPFVDLLKPEMEGVFTVLLALAPEKIESIPDVMSNLVAAQTSGQHRISNVLGQTSSQEEEQAPAGRVASWEPRNHFATFLGAADSGRLGRAWEQSRVGTVTPEDLAGEGEILGAMQLARNLVSFWIRKVTQNQQEALRAALQDWGGSPETFALDGPCAVFDAIARWKPNVDVVIAGHTHLRRQKHLPNCGERSRAPIYLNTGTWIRLMRLTPNDFEPSRFDRIYEAMQAGSMDELDALGRGTLLKERTVAVVRPARGSVGVEAALCEFSPDVALGPASEDACTALKGWEQVRRG